ncbi:MAG: hypothetical protein US60_C0026G0014 [Microgenomates group bacterium GW2011_GWC1_37_8]|nr:MAG: hypothetical protein US60_C0026G0014 [Microgenomates group bacterium GW2011_GWC1_37_8]
MLQKSDSLIRIKSDRNRFLYLNSKYVKKLSRSIASICFRISIVSQINQITKFVKIKPVLFNFFSLLLKGQINNNPLL